MPPFSKYNLVYSAAYRDDEYEYRHVKMPEWGHPYFPRKLLTYAEWIDLGVCVNADWEHYLIHEPSPEVLLFRRARAPQ